MTAEAQAGQGFGEDRAGQVFGQFGQCFGKAMSRCRHLAANDDARATTDAGGQASDGVRRNVKLGMADGNL